MADSSASGGFGADHPDDAISVTFWGVRGSIPAPGPDTLRYGGETTCIEVRIGPRTVVIDSGSGVRHCGGALRRRGIDKLDVLFTHTHLDHICGLPFFCLAYNPEVPVNLWAGHIPPGGSLEEIVERLMSPPIFPVATSALANTHFRSFKAGETIDLGDGVTVRTTPLNHPGNATGYRFDWKGSSVAVVTDHEHGKPEIDGPLEAFVEGASVMIYDAMYRDDEYEKFVGWGHSTPGKAVALAGRAGVDRTVLFHHDPRRTDHELDTLSAELRAEGAAAVPARQGETITLIGGKRVEPDMAWQAAGMRPASGSFPSGGD